MSPDTLPLITLILIPAWARRPHSSGWRYRPSGALGVVLSTVLMLLPFGHT
jgi:Protein of unknown function (DUF3309)